MREIIKYQIAAERGEERDLGVQHDGTENAGILNGSTEIVKSFLMILVRAMREVEPSNIHAGNKQLLYHLHRPRRRSQSANYLRLGPLLTLNFITQISILHSIKQTITHIRKDIFIKSHRKNRDFKS